MVTMQLSNHDLSQLDEEELLKLPEEALRRLSIRLLNDLKEARERLNRNSHNSSRPPSSEAPWEKERSATDSEDVFEPTKDAESQDESLPEPAKDCDGESKAVQEKAADDPSRRAGKQPGAPGFGRQQSLPVTAHEVHIPEFCVRCDQALNADRKKAWTAFDTVDIERGDENRPGVQRQAILDIPIMKFPARVAIPLEWNRIATLQMTACHRFSAVSGVWWGRSWPR